MFRIIPKILKIMGSVFGIIESKSLITLKTLTLTLQTGDTISLQTISLLYLESISN